MNEKIEIINPKKVKYVFCPGCKYKKIRAEFHEKNNERWIIARECEKKFGGCGFKKILFQEDVDTIQPTSELWNLVYDNSQFDEYRKNKLAREREEEERKSFLDLKYNKQFTKPWERKLVKKWVLGG